MTEADQDPERRAWLAALQEGDLLSIRSPDGTFIQKVIRMTDDYILVVGRLTEMERYALRFWKTTGIMVNGSGHVYLEPLNDEQRALIRRGEMIGALQETVWSSLDNEGLETLLRVVAEAKTRMEFEKQFKAERRGGTQ